MNSVKRLFKLIVSPQSEWEAISGEEGTTSEKLSSSLLYPILGIFAIIVFFKEIEFTSLRSDSGIEKAIQYAAIAFIQFFSTYFVASYISKKIFKQLNTLRCNIYLIYLTSITVLFYIIMTLFSKYVSYIAPLSLYIIYEAWIGYKYIDQGADKTNSNFVVAMSTITLMLPLVISFILRTLLTLV